ncbi:MAG: Uma2 family endonuclease [Pseudomonadota bacterium]
MDSATLPDAQAASQARKRLFTVDEFLTMCEAGVFKEGEHPELWDGEIIMAPSEGGAHFNVKAALNELLTLHRPAGLRVGPTGPLKMGERWLLEPDVFWFEPRGPTDIPEPAQMKLVIEVAVTSLKRDRAEKALRYAQAGIEDYWVVDAERLITWAHRKPSADGYGDVREIAPNESLSPLAAPTLSLRMNELFPD